MNSQLTQYPENGCVKDKCLLRIAQVMVRNPMLKGKTRRIFFLKARCNLMKRGRGIDMIKISLDRLNARFMIRWCNAVVH